MKRFLKISTVIITLMLLFFVAFFFWASSSTLSEKKYSILQTLNYPHNNDNDSIHSIVTYNIGHLSGLYNDTTFKSKSFYKKQIKSITKLLSSLEPDIIAFQDIDFDSKRSYNINQSFEFSKMGYHNTFDVIYWDKSYILSPYWPISKQTGKITSGQSILSNFKIEEYERVILKNIENLPFYKKAFYQDRIVQIAQIIVQGKSVILMNVHLENNSKPTRIVQFKQVLDLFKKYSSLYPTILLGDFNSSIKKDDAIIKVLFELDGIGHSKYKNLDYIFFNKNAIEVIDSRVLNEFETIANHVPLFMKFKLK